MNPKQVKQHAEWFKYMEKGMMVDFYDIKNRHWKSGHVSAVSQTKVTVISCMPTFDEQTGFESFPKDPKYFAPLHYNFPILEEEPNRSKDTTL